MRGHFAVLLCVLGVSSGGLGSSTFTRLVGKTAQFKFEDGTIPQGRHRQPEPRSLSTSEALSSVRVQPNGEILTRDLTNEETNAYLAGESFAATSGYAPSIKHDAFVDSRPEYFRIRVFDTMFIPFRSIGRVSTGCTGTMISPRAVLTAAHCVYDADTDEWHSSLSFSPARNGSDYPFGTVAWEYVYAPRGYTVGHTSNYDYAVIILKKPVGEQTGYLPFGYDEHVGYYEVTISGYPGDKPAGTQWKSACPVDDLSTHSLYYLCDTAPGMSGSGVYTHFPDRDQEVVFGVHTDGLDECNRGTRITKGKFHQIQEWFEAHP